MNFPSLYSFPLVKMYNLYYIINHIIVTFKAVLWLSLITALSFKIEVKTQNPLPISQ